MNINIYRRGVSIATVQVTDNSYVNRTILSDDTAYLEFLVTDAIVLYPGDYVVIDEMYYFIRDVAIPIRDVSRLFYKLTLYAEQYELSKATFFIFDSTGVDQTSDSSWTATPTEIVTQLVAIMNRLQPGVGWAVGTCLDNDPLLLTFKDNDCYEVLTSAATLFVTEWWIEGFTINLAKKEVTPVNKKMLEVGKDKGLRDLTAIQSTDSKYITRLYAFGSTRNDVNGKRLTMTVPYLEVVGAPEIVEEVQSFDDIYPRHNGVISAVRIANGIYYLQDSALTFNPNDY